MARKNRYTYRLSYFLITALVVEVLFWGIALQVLKLLGFFSKEATGERFAFLYPEYSWWFLSVFVLLGVFVWQMLRRNAMISKFSNLNTPSLLFRTVSGQRLFIKYFWIRNIIVFGIIALMQPVYGSRSVQGISSGVEIVFAIDLSNSMNTRDIKGKETRLTVAKRSINEIINKAPASQIGLVIFAGNAYVQLPLTHDLDIAKMHVNELSTTLLSNQGTNISSALQEASILFSKDNNNKFLVLITDGEDHEGDLETGYKLIKEKDIQTLVMGIGSENGGIVLESEDSNAKYLKDIYGETVISKVDRKMLREISSELGGEMMVTNESFPNIYGFLTEINTPSTSKVVNLEFQVKSNQYQWPLAVALLFVLALFGWELTQKRKG